MWAAEEYPEAYRPARANLPDQEMTVQETIDIRDSPLSEAELVDIGKKTSDAPEQDGYGGEDSLGIGVIFDGSQHGHVRP